MSDDTDYSGASSASETGSSTDIGAVQSVKEAAWQAIQNAPGETADDFAEELKDRKADEEGQELPAPRKRERQARFARALQAAREAEATPRPDKRDALERAADEDNDEPSRHESGDELRQEDPRETEAHQRARDEAIATKTKYEMRASAFEQAVPSYRETIQSVFGVFPPQESVADALLKSEVGPELAYRLSQDIDAIEELNALPPAEAAKRIARAEGMLIALHGQQQAAPPPRRATKMTKPLSSVRGGAGRAFDPNTSNDMDAFAGWLKKDLAKRQGR